MASRDSRREQAEVADDWMNHDSQQKRYASQDAFSTTTSPKAPVNKPSLGEYAAYALGYAVVGFVVLSQFHLYTMRKRSTVYLKKLHLPPITYEQARACKQFANLNSTVRLTFSEEGNKEWMSVFMKHAESLAQANRDHNNVKSDPQTIEEKILSRGWVRPEDDVNQSDQSNKKRPVEPPFGLGVTGQERELRRMVPQNRRAYEMAKQMDNKLYRMKKDARNSTKK